MPPTSTFSHFAFLFEFYIQCLSLVICQPIENSLAQACVAAVNQRYYCYQHLLSLWTKSKQWKISSITEKYKFSQRQISGTTESPLFQTLKISGWSVNSVDYWISTPLGSGISVDWSVNSAILLNLRCPHNYEGSNISALKAAEMQRTLPWQRPLFFGKGKCYCCPLSG